MTHDEAENFLAHYGKLGMKWGRRNGTSNLAIGKPHLGKNLLLGTAGRPDKYQYSDTAKRLRKDVTSYRKAAAVFAGGTAASLAIAKLAKSPQVKLGASAAAYILGLSTGYASTAGSLLGTAAVAVEGSARKKAQNN